MPEDPATAAGPPPIELRAVVVAGHRGDEATARDALAADDPSVRAAAVGALARMGALAAAELVSALADPSPVVRRRACAEAAPRTGGPGIRRLDVALRAALDDVDPLVVESACWALGEHRHRAATADLAAVVVGHADARCREAAVAALGAIGEPSGLPAVLSALGDRPVVRRRAVVALAAFEGPDADRALRAALDDRDWQVRQAAEELVGGAGRGLASG